MPDFAFGLADLLPFILIGFAAQLVDGALGMAFGVISSTLLISIGVPPAAASAGVHVVESFTTGVSGISHVLHRNVRWHLFLRLVIPGVLGGVIGAYLLTQIDASVARPFVLTYLAAVGLYLLWRGLGHEAHEKEPRVIAPLGLVGGFLDAAGGGGWGPVVTSNLLVQGANPRHVIGSVNTAEFFITVAVSAPAMPITPASGGRCGLASTEPAARQAMVAIQTDFMVWRSMTRPAIVRVRLASRRWHRGQLL